MSKAFTKEDGGNDEPLPIERSLPRGEALITPRGFRAMQAEHDVLAAAPVPEELSAKREREHRLQYLELRLTEVRPVEPSAEQTGCVYFGAHVSVTDEDGSVKHYQLVGPDEAEVSAGRVSVESPLGRALLGKRVGDSASVERPRGPVELTVTHIDYDPNSGGFGA